MVSLYSWSRVVFLVGSLADDILHYGKKGKEQFVGTIRRKVTFGICIVLVKNARQKMKARQLRLSTQILYFLMDVY